MQLNDHAIVSLNEVFYPDGSLELRYRLNKGEELTPEELSMLPYSKVISEIKIENSDGVINLKNIVSSIGGNSQSLFEINGCDYESFFVDPSDIRIQNYLLKNVKKEFPDFWDAWVNDNIFISFSKGMGK
ncbi:hypothetical protein [Xenorhabdus innexi]|uniref:Uncharacterized protein n=1 Tax=Xenorhabdus innexi TaxID=290109 RepID=A0A1N6N0Y9_9GAMM|nr:hypothetical protein [Xenorhabdus innexi]PHM25032.1 hypothetical protein Xinn_04059 [Xenorhabdus innexi]SIP74682.1 hypothetical protein XIS1_770002 [Xenorhabdus innexi]